MLYDLLRPLIFRLSAGDPEHAHEWVMRLLVGLSRTPAPVVERMLGPKMADPHLRQQVFGLDFPNPVGVAAGFDKNAVAFPALAALGFGFVEVGTVTSQPQPGNERPRILRLPEHAALINRMGFNNDGAAVIARRLARAAPPPVPLGISLGKSRITPIGHAVEDYRAAFRLLAPYADYIAVNVSSPNTPGLRALQQRDQIESLLVALRQEAAGRTTRHGGPLPILVKIAPDLDDAAIDDLLDVCLAVGIDGVIAVNTTLDRPLPRASAGAIERAARFEGGLSGRPLFPRALAVVRRIAAHTDGRLPIIGVGGIFTAADAYAMIRAGAALVQVYTGLIYEGPMIAHRINRGLVRLIGRDQVSTVAGLRGGAAPAGSGRAPEPAHR